MPNKEATQAVLPSGMDFIRKIRHETKTEEADPTEAIDRSLAVLSQMDGWQIIRKRIEAEIEKIKGLRDTEAIYSMSEEEIGKRFIVASLITEKLEWVLGMVEAPATYYDEKDNELATK